MALYLRFFLRLKGVFFCTEFYVNYHFVFFFVFGGNLKEDANNQQKGPDIMRTLSFTVSMYKFSKMLKNDIVFISF